MWIFLILSCFGATVRSNENAWKNSTTYKYQLEGRTLVALNQVSNQWTGILFKADVEIHLRCQKTLNVQVKRALNTQIHTNQTKGWWAPMLDSELNYQPMNLTNSAFEIILKNGVVKNMVVSKDIPVWELNILKSIASLLQIDTQASNLQKSKFNKRPQNNSTSGIYKTMEDSVEGKCETLYTISPLQDDVYQSQPQLAPQAHLKGQGHLIDVIKTRNFSNCDMRAAYHFGITAETNWKPASNHMGNLMSRFSISRAILSGSLNMYTIQSSVTTNKIIVSPFIHNNQKGMVVSRLNLTLTSVSSASKMPRGLTFEKRIKNLVYNYNPASDTTSQKPWHNTFKFEIDEHYDSLNSSSSVSEENLSYSSSSMASSESGSYSVEGYSNSNSKESSECSESFSPFSPKSNEKEIYKGRPMLFEAPEIPFLELFVANHGNSIQTVSNLNTEVVVEELALAIGAELQFPSAIPGQNTLSKFVLLTRVLRTMNSRQLQNLTIQLYTSSSKTSHKDPKKYQAWCAFRDAVAQAGTGPALTALKDMIHSNKVSNEEAAQLISVLPSAARFPSLNYLHTFYEFAVKNPAVRSRRFLNTSAIMAFTELACRAFINNETAYNRYLVHVFGTVASEESHIIVRKFIPIITTMLRDAINKFDSHKIQVYSMALGNLAHPEILKAFRPYIEGKHPLPHFQRLVMVRSLKRMAQLYPTFARSILLKIFTNTAEIPEVRVAAVYEIMRTNPPVQTLQTMAQLTNHDGQNKQVVSAVQSSIKSAAAIQNAFSNDDQIIAKEARATIPLLNPKELGVQFSKSYRRSKNVKEMNLAYQQQMSFIGSDDSLFPSNVFYTLLSNWGGFKRQSIDISAMSSSVPNLVDKVFGQLSNDFSHRSSPRQKKSSYKYPSLWSPKKIATMLKIKSKETGPVEANLQISAFGNKRFFTMDGNTIDKIPELIKHGATALASGKRFNFTKFYNQLSLSVGFPTATGLPFYYQFSIPTLVHVGGKAQLQTTPDLVREDSQVNIPHYVNASADIQLLYSSKTQSRMGFVTPYNQHAYIAGLEKNIQINLPFRTEVHVDKTNNKIQAKTALLYPKDEQNLFEYSTIPYTSKFNVINMIKNVNQVLNKQKIISVRQPRKWKMTIGQDSTGLAFNIKYNSEQPSIDFVSLYNKINRHEDFISAMAFAWAEESINRNNITVAYNPHKSTAKQVTLTAAYTMAFAWAEESINRNNITVAYNPHKSTAKQVTLTAAYTMAFAWAEESINRNNITVAYNPHKSTAKQVTLTAAYRNNTYFYNYGELVKESQQYNRMKEKSPDFVSIYTDEPSSTAPESLKRQKQFYTTVSSGIKNSTAMVFDFSAKFQGQTKAMYVATFAVASSYVSPKTKGHLFLGKYPAQINFKSKPYQACMTASAYFPKVPLMNFRIAMNANSKSYVNAQISMGEKCNHSSAAKIIIQSKLTQTEERKQYIKNSPLAQLCNKQMLLGNTLQSACRNMTFEANILNHAKFSIHFEKVPKPIQNATYKIYSFIRQAAYSYHSENFLIARNRSKELNFEIKVSPKLKYINISLDAPIFSAQFNNMELHPFLRPLVTAHPEYSSIENIFQIATDNQYESACVVDNHLAQTFDNKTYPIKLGKCWHAMFQDTSKAYQSRHHSYSSQNKVSVLVRDSSSTEQKDVMILLEENVISLRPSGSSSSTSNPGISLQINGHQESLSSNTLEERYDAKGEVFLQYYALPSGAIRIFAIQHNLQVQYDGTGVKILAKNSYRSQVRGLCGNFDNEPANDFNTGNNCILQNPFLFAATNAVTDLSCQGPSKDLKLHVLQTQCFSSNHRF